jgi:AcrR family transcriptional regulator
VTDLRITKGQATRDRLLAAAQELFGSRGYDGTSIEAVLDATDTKRGSLYHHFASKEELFDAVLDRLVAGITESVAAAASAAGPDPVDALVAGCRVWLRLALDPAIQRIFLVDAPAVVGWTRLRQLDERHTLGRLRAGLQRASGLPAEQVDVLAHMLLAALNEAALLIARAEDPQEVLATAEVAVGTLIDRLVGMPKRRGRGTDE